MKKITWENLNSQQYQIAYKELKEVLKKGKLSTKEIKNILSIKNKLVIGDFLEAYCFYDNKDIQYIKEYICKNLDNSDKLFVSDLIEFATDHRIELPYEKCLDFMDIYGDDNDYVQLASIDYVFENIKFLYIERIKKSLDNILKYSDRNISCQIKASFVLFRITMNKKYLNDLIYLIGNDPQNKILLSNILKNTWNKQKYFDYSNFLSLISKC